MERLTRARPLEGIRVLELGSLIAGPFASRLFADFGADVIKVEPHDGDPLRTWGAPSPSGSTWWWHVQSRNKKLMAVDLRTAAGQEVIRELATKVDVIIENFRPGRMEKWNLGYEQVVKVNPGIIYVSVSGFGQTGPYRSRPGFGNIAESMGGIRYVTGFPDRPPLRVGVSLGDEVAALYAVIGALMSLLRREKTQDGKGDHVDVALTDAVFSLTEGSITDYLHAGIIQERKGNQLLRTAPSNIYPTKDGRWMAIGANTPTTFPRLLKAMNREDLLDDCRFIDNAARVQHADELDLLISQWTSTKTLKELWNLLTDAEVPSGPVMSVADIAADEHYRARDMIISAPSDQVGEVSMPGLVPKLTNHPGEVRFAGGPLGNDTDTIIRDILGWSSEQIEEARKQGVIR